MSARRYSRGEWIVRVIAAFLACIGVALSAATVAQVAAIYAPNPHVPFLTSAVRG